MLKVFCLVALASLVACGGGGSGSSTPQIGSSPSLLPIPAGIYYGIDMYNTLGVGYPVVGAVDPNGNFKVAEIATGDGVGCFGGLLNASASSFSGIATHYNSPAYHQNHKQYQQNLVF